MPRSAAPLRSTPVILLPPSEGKARGGGRPAWKTTSGEFGRELSRWRGQIVLALQDVDGGDANLLGVKGAHLEHARAVNTSLVGSATLPAWKRYTGVLWDHVDVPTLSQAAFERARQSVVVVSGLLGLVGFDDPIPDYKLKIGATLDLPVSPHERKRQKLATFWQPHVSRALNDWVSGRVVIDLLPLEHRRVWSAAEGLDVLKVSFVDRRGRAVGHDAKAAKGEFVRHLLIARSPLRAIESWSHPDYRIDISAG